jgi:hypothetical protein
MQIENPFALASHAKAARNRIRAEAVKADLQARHAAAPDEWLSASVEPLPAGTETPDAFARYENPLPDDVKEAVIFADAMAKRVGAFQSASLPSARGVARRFATWVTHAPTTRRRPRRRTDKKASGRPQNADVGLSGAVDALVASGRSRKQAIEVLAHWIASTGAPGRLIPTFKAARDRVYRALSHRT